VTLIVQKGVRTPFLRVPTPLHPWLKRYLIFLEHFELRVTTKKNRLQGPTIL